jgi:hypothetical protein
MSKCFIVNTLLFKNVNFEIKQFYLSFFKYFWGHKRRVGHLIAQFPSK